MNVCGLASVASLATTSMTLIANSSGYPGGGFITNCFSVMLPALNSAGVFLVHNTCLQLELTPANFEV